MIQYQILQTNLTRTVRQTVRRITNEILRVKGLTNGFLVAVRLFSNRSQLMSKCGEDKNVAHKTQLSVSLIL